MRWIPIVSLWVVAACGLSDEAPVETQPEPATTVSETETGGTIEEPEGPTPSVPLFGGTVAASGPWSAFADPGLDALVLWHEDNTSPGGLIDLARGSQPFRVAFADDKVYVTLRGTGEVAKFSTIPFEEQSRTWVCPAVRGLEITDEGPIIACASGELVQLDHDLGVLRQRHIGYDLRDVVANGDGLWVSRFRSAEVLQLDRETWQHVATYHPDMGQTEHRTNTAPHVAWRLRAFPGGGVGMVHQAASLLDIDIGSGGEDPSKNPNTSDDPVYGNRRDAGCAEDVTVTAHLTRIDDRGAVHTSGVLRGATLALDLDFASDGTTLVMVRTSPFNDLSSLFFFPPSAFDEPGCVTTTNSYIMPGLGTSVAASPSGGFAANTRSPSFAILSGQIAEILDRDRTPLVETSLLQFHADPGTGVTCASCHPEGQDDGHVWQFSGLGPRRTLSLSGNVSQRAPFHWDGEFAEFTGLMTEVFGRRMGARNVQEIESGLLLDWLDRIQVTQTTPEADLATVEGGRQLFEDSRVGCTDCHGGPDYSDHQLHVVVENAEPRKTPSLRGVGSRAPYMHNGCASTLHRRFTVPSCGGGDLHGTTSHLEPEDVDALVAYLQSVR